MTVSNPPPTGVMVVSVSGRMSPSKTNYTILIYKWIGGKFSKASKSPSSQESCWIGLNIPFWSLDDPGISDKRAVTDKPAFVKPSYDTRKSKDLNFLGLFCSTLAQAFTANCFCEIPCLSTSNAALKIKDSNWTHMTFLASLIPNSSIM